MHQQQSQNIGAQMRERYFSGVSSNVPPVRNSSPDYLSNNNIAKSDDDSNIRRLTYENNQLRQENERLREELRAAQNRNTISSDMKDLTRGNRLLTQENALLSEKYQSLLEVHNRVLLQTSLQQPNQQQQAQGQQAPQLSPQQLAETFALESQARVAALKDVTSADRWEDFSEKSREFELNNRTINEIFTKTHSKFQAALYQFDAPWKTIASEIHEALNDVLRVNQEQVNLHSQLAVNQQVQNRELKRQVAQANQAATSATSSIAEQLISVQTPQPVAPKKKRTATGSNATTGSSSTAKKDSATASQARRHRSPDGSAVPTRPTTAAATTRPTATGATTRPTATAGGATTTTTTTRPTTAATTTRPTATAGGATTSTTTRPTTAATAGASASGMGSTVRKNTASTQNQQKPTEGQLPRSRAQL